MHKRKCWNTRFCPWIKRQSCWCRNPLSAVLKIIVTSPIRDNLKLGTENREPSSCHIERGNIMLSRFACQKQDPVVHLCPLSSGSWRICFSSISSAVVPSSPESRNLIHWCVRYKCDLPIDTNTSASLMFRIAENLRLALCCVSKTAGSIEGLLPLKSRGPQHWQHLPQLQHMRRLHSLTTLRSGIRLNGGGMQPISLK